MRFRLKAKLIGWMFQKTNLIFGYAVDYDENRNVTGVEVQWDLLGRRKRRLLEAADDEPHVMGTVLFPQKEGVSHEDS